VRKSRTTSIHTKFRSQFLLANEDVPFINTDIDLQRIAKDKYCREGDLVIADASEDYDDIGKTIELIDLDNEKVLAGLHTLLARPLNDDIFIGYGAYMMACENVRKQIKIIAQGTKVLGLSTGRMNKILLPVPSKPEQQKIAAFLAAIDCKMGVISNERS